MDEDKPDNVEDGASVQPAGDAEGTDEKGDQPSELDRLDPPDTPAEPGPEVSDPVPDSPQEPVDSVEPEPEAEPEPEDPQQPAQPAVPVDDIHKADKLEAADGTVIAHVARYGAVLDTENEGCDVAAALSFLSANRYFIISESEGTALFFRVPKNRDNPNRPVADDKESNQRLGFN